MKKLKLNIQLFAATATISNSRKSVDETNNKEVQTLTFTVKRTSGTTYWDSQKTLTWKLTYLNDNGTKQIITKTSTFNFPSNVTTKTATMDFDVPHLSNGKQTISYSATIVTGTGSGTLSPSQENVELQQINVNNVRVYVNGSWKTGKLYIYKNNVWKQATAYIFKNNEWKKSI